MRSRILIAATVVSTTISQAQSVEQKLIAQGSLDSADVSALTVFDTLAYRLDFGTVSVDTTVLLSNSILYSIIMIGDVTGVNALFYLMSFDRGGERPIDLVYLHDAPDIEQSLKRYRWVEHGVWRTGEIGTIEYDCRVTRPGSLRERASMQAHGRRFWRVGPGGRITGGELVKEQ